MIDTAASPARRPRSASHWKAGSALSGSHENPLFAAAQGADSQYVPAPEHKRQDSRGSKVEGNPLFERQSGARPRSSGSVIRFAAAEDDNYSSPGARGRSASRLRSSADPFHHGVRSQMPSINFVHGRIACA